MENMDTLSTVFNSVVVVVVAAARQGPSANAPMLLQFSIVLRVAGRCCLPVFRTQSGERGKKARSFISQPIHAGFHCFLQTFCSSISRYFDIIT